MARLNIRRKVDHTQQCSQCGSKKVQPKILNESMDCGACGITYSVMTGRKLLSEQKHGALKPKTTNYVRGLGYTTHGNRTIDVNDKVAKMLRGTDPLEMYQIAAEVLKVSARTLKRDYKHLNIGMQRMNLGNRMRKELRK
jgi:transcription initiation factor TFIIIB Brf1 subunit/transcription initiation factor TFIIB